MSDLACWTCGTRAAPDARVDLVASDAGIVRALQIARLDTMFSVHASLADALDD